ncbi:hypothetical protein SHIRM173S_00517 [Streptomyces hirsutus]
MSTLDVNEAASGTGKPPVVLWAGRTSATRHVSRNTPQRAADLPSIVLARTARSRQSPWSGRTRGKPGLRPSRGCPHTPPEGAHRRLICFCRPTATVSQSYCGEGAEINSFMELFSSHWRMTKRELAEALKESLIVLDSSVMLDLYRVTPSARAEMINSLLTVKEILWIPYQVALEFHSNRVEAAQDQLNFYNDTCKSLEAAQNQAIQRLNEFANRSALGDGEKKKLKGPLEQAFRVAIERVRSHQGVFDLTLSKVLNDDPVLKALAQLSRWKGG